MFVGSIFCSRPPDVLQKYANTKTLALSPHVNFAKFGDTLTEGDSSDEQSSKYEQEK